MAPFVCAMRKVEGHLDFKKLLIVLESIIFSALVERESCDNSFDEVSLFVFGFVLVDLNISE